MFWQFVRIVAFEEIQDQGSRGSPSHRRDGLMFLRGWQRMTQNNYGDVFSQGCCYTSGTGYFACVETCVLNEHSPAVEKMAIRFN
jgi:hypothetical protein